MTCRLSIVIPSHSRADLLRRCLTSVARHSPPNTEILVVDDGSPAQAVSRAATYLPRARVIRFSRRPGFCAAVNAGIESSRAPIIEVLNDDTEVTAGWAEAALTRFEDANVVAVAPLVLRFGGANDAPVIDSAGDDYDCGGFARKRGHGQTVCSDSTAGREVFGASASSAFYRRDALVRVGAFPESFGAYFEDVDLAFRLHRAGHRVLFEPRSRVLHRVSASYGRPRRRLLEQQSRNEERVFWRNLPDDLLRRSLARHVAVLAAKAARRWQEGWLLPWILGRLRAWREIPANRRHARGLERLGTLRPW